MIKTCISSYSPIQEEFKSLLFHCSGLKDTLIKGICLCHVEGVIRDFYGLRQSI